MLPDEQIIKLNSQYDSGVKSELEAQRDSAEYDQFLFTPRGGCNK